MEIFKEFTLDSAHYLPRVPESHKCRRIHGHTFRVGIHVSGSLHPELGWVGDFADLETAFAPLHDALDHRLLNDVDGLANPTSERLAEWIWERLAPSLPGLARVVVKETCTSGCSYEGPSRSGSRPAAPRARGVADG
jgi:6-pyruvoyltetrahydropterin/6-carboxytetrahydropterin synthase